MLKSRTLTLFQGKVQHDDRSFIYFLSSRIYVGISILIQVYFIRMTSFIPIIHIFDHRSIRVSNNYLFYF